MAIKMKIYNKPVNFCQKISLDYLACWSLMSVTDLHPQWPKKVQIGISSMSCTLRGYILIMILIITETFYQGLHRDLFSQRDNRIMELYWKEPLKVF